MKITGPVFMIVFEDRDVSPEVFAGEQAESCARQRFKQVLDNWNASLFQRIDDGVRATSNPERRRAVIVPPHLIPSYSGNPRPLATRPVGRLYTSNTGAAK